MTDHEWQRSFASQNSRIFSGSEVSLFPDHPPPMPVLVICLFPLALAVSVPRNASKLLATVSVNLDGLIERVNEEQNVVAFVADPIDNRLVTSFLQSQSLFREASFILPFPRAMKSWLKSPRPPPPKVVII
jgi:hypothetical protein